jgi:thiol-disulfide isomerase/thioredoxin
MLNFNKLIPKLSFIFFFFLQNQLFGQKLLVSEILNDTVAVVNDNKLISNIRIGDIKQKYIIIDLWATWCKPCIDNHKNLENIYSRHSDSLAVITLCGDTYNNFSRFNESWKSRLIKGIDTANKFFKKYKIGIVPTLLLINKHTMNLYVTSGTMMSEELFNDFSKGETTKSDTIPIILEPEVVVTRYFRDQKIYTGIIESKFIPNSSSFLYYRPPSSGINYRKIYVNFTIPGIYKDCYAMSEVRTVYDFAQGLENYSSFDMRVLRVKKTNPDQLMINYLEKEYPEIKAKVVKLIADSCYVLEKIKGGNISQSNDAITNETIRGNYFKGNKTPLKKVCFFLEEQLRIPVENLAGKKLYDIEFEYHYGDIDDLNKQLALSGLRLTLVKNKLIKYLVFQKNVISLR